MNCPHCLSTNIRELSHKTDLSYPQFYCRACAKQYNERTGAELNFIVYRTEVVMMAIHYYYRFKKSV